MVIYKEKVFNIMLHLEAGLQNKIS